MMKSNLIAISCIGFALMLAAIDLKAQETVSIDSLLREMVDRDELAQYPAKDFRLRQDSSYNRASKTPDEPVGWFANSDFNNHRNQTGRFIRVEENDGRKEWVLMESDAPGVITRTWWPVNYLEGKDVVMRFYLDGESTPALEGHPLEMFQGEGLVPYPLSHPSHLSAVNFFPIPYAKSCKVTLSVEPFFFIFTYREYDAGTVVKSFTMDDFEAAKPLTQEVCKMLMNPEASGAGEAIGFTTTLAKGEEQSIDLPTGPAAVREVSVKLGDYTDPNVTRTVVLKIEFDGRETVWCPIGDFFGAGIGLNPFQGWYRTVGEDGTMSARWVMPYQEGAKVSLVNLGNEAVEASLQLKTGKWGWDERSMTFNAMWRGQYPVPTRPRSDWNYVTTSGRGVFVGDTLTIMNPDKKWWGEGDAKIWVDGEDFPSIFGTGTEDYYGYAWGGKTTDFYEHPFHAQVFCNVYNKLNRKPKEVYMVRDTQGFSTETRTRALDTMPFGKSLQVDMEVWAFTDQDMGYQVGAYWYGFADTTSNRKPEPVEVLNVPVLPDMGSEVVAGGAEQFKDAVEITEGMVIDKPATLVIKPQNLKSFGLKGTWHKDSQLLFKNAQVGDVIEIRIPATSPVAQTLALHGTKASDYGVFAFTVNDKPVKKKFDLYAAKPIPSGMIQLGTFEPVDSVYMLRIEVVGKNSKSEGTYLGIDCVTLSEAKPE